MNRIANTAATIAWIAASAAVCGAQSPPQNAVQPTAEQKTIVLPPLIMAGERTTLAVLDGEGRIEPGVAVEISGGEKITTDSTGRGTFIAPSQAGPMNAQLNDGTSFVSTVISEKGSSSVRLRADAGALIYPRIVALGDTFAIEGGGFRGDVLLDRVKLGGVVAFVLAASSASLVALPAPETPIGKTQFELTVEGHDVPPLPITIISLDVTGPSAALRPDRKGTLTVGVNGTTKRLPIEVHNDTPNVILLPRGDTLRVVTSGGTLNVATIHFISVNPGDYEVSARLAQPEDKVP